MKFCCTGISLAAGKAGQTLPGSRFKPQFEVHSHLSVLHQEAADIRGLISFSLNKLSL